MKTLVRSQRTCFLFSLIRNPFHMIVFCNIFQKLASFGSFIIGLQAPLLAFFKNIDLLNPKRDLLNEKEMLFVLLHGHAEHLAEQLAVQLAVRLTVWCSKAYYMICVDYGTAAV